MYKLDSYEKMIDVIGEMFQFGMVLKKSATYNWEKETRVHRVQNDCHNLVVGRNALSCTGTTLSEFSGL